MNEKDHNKPFYLDELEDAGEVSREQALDALLKNSADVETPPFLAAKLQTLIKDRKPVRPTLFRVIGWSAGLCAFLLLAVLSTPLWNPNESFRFSNSDQHWNLPLTGYKKGAAQSIQTQDARMMTTADDDVRSGEGTEAGNEAEPEALEISEELQREEKKELKTLLFGSDAGDGTSDDHLDEPTIGVTLPPEPDQANAVEDIKKDQPAPAKGGAGYADTEMSRPARDPEPLIDADESPREEPTESMDAVELAEIPATPTASPPGALKRLNAPYGNTRGMGGPATASFTNLYTDSGVYQAVYSNFSPVSPVHRPKAKRIPPAEREEQRSRDKQEGSDEEDAETGVEIDWTYTSNYSEMMQSHHTVPMDIQPARIAEQYDANELNVVANNRNISAAIHTFWFERNHLPSSANEILGSWHLMTDPRNPYTGGAITAGTQPGQFTYEKTDKGFIVRSYSEKGILVEMGAALTDDTESQRLKFENARGADKAHLAASQQLSYLVELYHGIYGVLPFEADQLDQERFASTRFRLRANELGVDLGLNNKRIELDYNWLSSTSYTVACMLGGMKLTERPRNLD